MSYLQISNKGEINPYALSLMGASTKRGNDGQIGFFGTGNKYALAKFLREGLDVEIHSGLNKIEIDTHDISMGDQTFSVVRVNGVDTSITTDMGPTWELWQAVREVYSNAIDGGEANICMVDQPTSRDGYTNYHVEANDDLEKIMSDFDLYFSTARIAAESSEYGSIFEGGTGTVYRHGIRCIEEGRESVFDYELGEIKLTETRIAEYHWQVATKVWGSILTSDNESIITRAFAASSDGKLLEGELASTWGVDFPESVSDTVKSWLSENMVADSTMTSMMDDQEKVMATFISSSLMKHLIGVVGRKNMVLPRKATFAGEVLYSVVDLSTNDLALLREAKAVIARAGITINHPMIAAQFAKSGMMGFADMSAQRIVLSETIFSMGITMIVGTILEEWIHLKYGVKDETRPMQDAILNEFSTVLVSMDAEQEQAA